MKDIKGFEGLYAITEDGRVWSYEKRWNWSKWKSRIKKPVIHKQKERWLKTNHNHRGYEFVMLQKNNVSKPVTVHRLVASAFIPNPNNLSEINHKNGIKDDNRVENLEWCSRQENVDHAIRTGLFIFKEQNGEKNKMSKLKEQEILEIRKLYKNGGVFMKDLAKQYKTTQSNISFIVNRKRWSSI